MHLHDVNIKCRYFDMSHHNDKHLDDLRFSKLEKGKERNDVDGLNSLRFDLVSVNSHQLYTNYTVLIDDMSARDFKKREFSMEDFDMRRRERKKRRRSNV